MTLEGTLPPYAGSGDKLGDNGAKLATFGGVRGVSIGWPAAGNGYTKYGDSHVDVCGI